MAPPQATSRTTRNGKENSKEQYDHSILAEPINLGVMNVAQIATCLEKGTAEMKDLVLNECNIIYECRVCKNLFRSLANFLAHKRIYCKEHLCEQMVLYDPAWLPDSSNGTVVEESSNKEDEPGEKQENFTKATVAQSTFKVMRSPRPSPSKTLNLRRTSESSTLPQRVPQTGNRKRKSLTSIVNECFTRQGPPEELSKAQSNSSVNALNFYSSKPSSSASNGPTEKKLKTADFSKVAPSKLAKAADDNTKEYAMLFKELHEELAQILAQTGTQMSELQDGTFGMQLLSVESLNKCYKAVGYLFNCPKCESVCHSFGSSIRHLIESHRFSRLRAKWVSFLQSSVAPSETNRNGGDSSKESINPVKIVKENGQYRSIPGILRMSVDSTSSETEKESANGEEMTVSNGIRKIVRQSNSSVAVNGNGKAPQTSRSSVLKTYAVQKELLLNLKKALPPGQYLQKSSFTGMFNVTDYVYRCQIDGCPKDTIKFFGTAMRHLVDVHKMPFPEAMMYAVEHGELADGGPKASSDSEGSSTTTSITNGDRTNGATKMTASQAKELETINNRTETIEASATPVSSQFAAANSLLAPKQSVVMKQIKAESDISKTNGTSISKGMNGARRTSSTISPEVITLSDDEDVSPTTTITNGVARKMTPSLEYFKLFDSIAVWNAHVAKSPNADTQFVVHHQLGLMINRKIKAGNPSGCTECPELVFQHRGLLLAHIALEHLNTPLMWCTLCKSFSSPNPPAMDEHMKEHHGVSTFIADLEKYHLNLINAEASNLPSEKASTSADAPAEH